MNKAAFLSIGRRLKAQCPALKHIDIFNQQYMPDMEGVSKPFQKPAAFIEFIDTVWEGDENEGVQEGNGGVRVHVVMSKLSDTYKIFDKAEAEQEAMLTHFDTTNQVQAALHGFAADGTLSAMTRVLSTPDHDYDNIIVEVHEYAYRDCDAAADKTIDYIEKQLTEVTATGSI